MSAARLAFLLLVVVVATSKSYHKLPQIKLVRRPPLPTVDVHADQATNVVLPPQSSRQQQHETEVFQSTSSSSSTTELSATNSTTARSVSSSSGSNVVQTGSANQVRDPFQASYFGSIALPTQRPQSDIPSEAGNFDMHLDGILENLAKTLRQSGFDPISIGNLLQCSNCSMEGLSLIRRNGPSNFMYVNRTVIVDAYIRMPAIYISCFPCVDVILMVPLTGMLEIAIWDLTIYGKVEQKVMRGASPQLVTYEVVDEGDLDISFNARGFLAPITEFGFKVIRQRQVSDIIRQFVYETVPRFIRRRLKGFTSPIGKK